MRDALEQRNGVRVGVAGLNMRPCRPQSKKGGRHLFTTIEDETGYTEDAFYGDAIDACMATILLSPIVVTGAIVKRRGLGAGLEVKRAVPLPVARLRRQASPQPSTEGISRELVRRGAHFIR